MAKYIDLRCDFGFKFCMQDETVMKSFLNAILEDETERITSVKFENVEMPRVTKGQRGVSFDLLCTTERGETILIEMQNSSQKFFKTRAMFYVHNLMRKQIVRGDKWEKMEKDIARIFGIFILGEGDKNLTKAITRTSVFDRDELTEFWDRNHNFFLSLPKFTFNKENLTSKNIWLHFLKNLGSMDRISPSVYERADEGLLKLLEKANVAALSEEEYDLYEASMKALEDEIDMEEHGYKRGVEDGIELGIEKGIPQGSHLHAIEVAQKMLQHNKPIEEIILFSGLSKEEIEAL
ncbi:MAG: Rpn family recombination-promoting nuclease/putative transposase [Paludibacteraceae bacterium]|nr:Rpn family recombination-promoting nuclease/putative transposase [Paludibacteraceae bacterium]